MAVASSMQRSALAALDLLLSAIKVSGDPSTTRDCEGTDLEPIETNIQHLVIAAKEFQNVVDAQLAQNRRRRNYLTSPILRLPDEILSLIFQIVKPEIVDYYHVGCSITDLCLVCNRFCQIANSTPTLWSNIEFRHAPRTSRARTLLEKSKSAPLMIVLGRFNLVDQVNTLDLLVDHMHRWEDASIQFELPSYVVPNGQLATLDVALSRLAQNKAPLLRKFVLQVGYKNPIHSTCINLFQGQAPQLRHLSIHPIAISWDNPILSGLTHLFISTWDGLTHPSAEQFVRLFKACPGLEILHLYGQSNDRYSPEAASFHQDLHLPNLVELSLKCIHPQTIRSIISSIRGSPERVLIRFPSLSTDQFRDVFHSIFQDQDLSLVSPARSSPHALRFSAFVSDNPASLLVISERIEGRSLELLFGFLESDHTLLVIPSLLMPSSMACVQTLFIGPNTELGSPTYSIRQLLEDLIELRELDIHCRHAYSLIVDALSSPIESTVGTDRVPTWICPRLQKLYVTFEGLRLAYLLQFAKSRYQHHSGHHPTMLERLVTCNYSSRLLPDDQALVPEFHSIFGSGVFEC